MRSHFYSLCHFNVFLCYQRWLCIINGKLAARGLCQRVCIFSYMRKREEGRESPVVRLRWKHWMWVRNERGDGPVSLPLAAMKMFAATASMLSALAAAWFDLVLFISSYFRNPTRLKHGCPRLEPESAARGLGGVCWSCQQRFRDGQTTDHAAV